MQGLCRQVVGHMLKGWRKTLKHYIGKLVFSIGLHRLLFRNKAIIVAFHTIVEDGQKSSIQVTPALFRQYCLFFKKYFEVVSLSKLLQDIRAGHDVSRQLVITFDDGYRDNYTFAAVELEKSGLPATFFVTTDFIDSQFVPWWDEKSDVRSKWMTWNQVIDLDRRGFDIGAHTMSHSNLSSNTKIRAREEIEGSKDILERKLGHSVVHFAYPYGRRSDINDEVRRIVGDVGFSCCVSCYGGIVQTKSDRMDLPRLPINDWYSSPYEMGLEALRSFHYAEGEYGGSAEVNYEVLVASHHLYPDAAVGARRPSELIRFLAAKGHDVEAIAASLGKNTPIDELLAARLSRMKVMRVPQPPSLIDGGWKQLKRMGRYFSARKHSGEPGSGEIAGKVKQETHETIVNRLRRHYNAMYSLYDARKLWAIFAVGRLLVRRLRKRYNIVISSGPPSSSHIVGYIAAIINDARFIMDFRDPWVGNSHISQRSNSRFREYLERKAELRCCAAADLIVVTTPGIQRMLTERYPHCQEKIHVIYNGYDGEPVAPATDPAGRLDMLYAGTLYLNRNPFPLLEAIKSLVSQECIDRSKVLVTLVGDCATWNGRSLEAWVQENGVTDVVKIQGRVSTSEIDQMIRNSSVLINFAQGQRDQIPAKTFDYFASGKEILLIAEKGSASAIVTEEIGCGITVDPGGYPDELPVVLMKLYQHFVRDNRSGPISTGNIAVFSRDNQFSRFLELAVTRDESRNRP